MNLADIRKKAGLDPDAPPVHDESASLDAASDRELEAHDTEQQDFVPPAAFMESILDDEEETCSALSSHGGGDEECPVEIPEPVAGLDAAWEHDAASVEEEPCSLGPEVQMDQEGPEEPASAPSSLPAADDAFLEVPVVFPAASAPFTAHSPLAVLLAGRAALLDDEEGDDEDLETVGDALLEYLCFRVSQELYAVNIMEIKEIIKPREWTEVPRAPHFVSGVISLRGVIIPVFDMRKRLGLPQVQACGKERIVVVRDGESFCGILVDEVVQVVRIPVTSIESAPAVLEGIDRDFVLGIGRHEEKMLILLSLEHILNLSLV